VKNQSSLTRSGSGGCILDQVYFMHLKGISTSLRLLMESLKANIFYVFAPGLFLSLEDPPRLKSPRIESCLEGGK
jgi:hypothetical protein